MQNKEPLFRMTKRSQISFGMIVLIHLIALVLALIVCAVVIVLITHVNPLGVYSAIYEGAVGNSRRFWVTVRETVVLLLIAVGLTPAFRMRFWNVGAEGQILMGGMISAALMIYCGGKLPNFLLILAMLLGSILAGMISGGAMIFIWKFVVRVAFAGSVLDIYELLPAFILNLVVAVVVSLITKAPAKELVDTFEQVKAEE